MNSDHFTPDTPPAPEGAPEEIGVSAPRHRRRARRATAQAPLEQAAAPEPAVSSAPDDETTAASPTRPRRRRAPRAAPVAAPAADVPAAAPALDPGAPPEEAGVTLAEEALAATGAAAGEVAEDGPPVRTRGGRRRNRGR